MIRPSRWLLSLSVLILINSAVAMPALAQDDPATTPDPAIFDLGFELVTDGLVQPVGIVSAGDGSGRLFVLERGGNIRIVQDGTLLDTPFLSITDRVGSQGQEQGLLGLAFAPDYADTGFFYIDYTNLDGTTVVARYTVTDDPNVADPASEQILLIQPQPYANHNGGHIVFGPDNYLYIGLGDGGSGGDPQGNAQNLQTWLGKILRIEVDPAFVPDGQPYGIPDDNPYADGQAGLPEIFASGFRNPWGFNFDPETGDLWIGDVGQETWEEIDYVPNGTDPGLNFGWNLTEGTHCYLTDPCTSPEFAMPVAEYNHAVGGCSVTGGVVYRGEEMPNLVGTYLYADYCSGLIWGLTVNANGTVVPAGDPVESGFMISTFGTGDDGRVYVTDMANGAIYELVAPL